MSQPGGPGKPADQNATPRHVLIVDDDPAVATTLAEYFEQKQTFTTRVASNAGVAIAAFIEHKPDLVLLDIGMPGMNGLELLQRLRRLNTRVPIIIVTGAGAVASTTAVSQGAFGVLAKPVDVRRLDTVVNLAISQHP